jgi:outer membrane protein OmpA-like peptidoglycan-associated protein
MRNATRLLTVTALCGVLAACGGLNLSQRSDVPPDQVGEGRLDPNQDDDLAMRVWDIDDVRNMAPQGSAFSQGLRSGYIDLADAERGEFLRSEYDHFIRKAVSSARGLSVTPDLVSLRTLNQAQVDELSAARARLMAGLDGNGRLKAPAAAARAQTSFDCWLENEGEGDLTGAAECKAAFEAAMAEVEQALATDIGNVYVVFFAWDRADITPVAATILDQVASDFERGEVPRIVLAGHTDTTGSAEYNMGLSERRARAAAAELIARGVPADAIEVTWFGETQLRVPTADEVREPQNRRVEMLFAE